jgi:hypothetical protein
VTFNSYPGSASPSNSPYDSAGGFGQQPAYQSAPSWSGQSSVQNLPPENHLVMALFGFVCCWPLGIASIAAAAKVNMYWYAGNAAAANQASEDAKKYAIIGLILNGACSLLYVLFYFVIFSAAFRR